jgi:hypothetical protein
VFLEYRTMDEVQKPSNSEYYCSYFYFFVSRGGGHSEYTVSKLVIQQNSQEMLTNRAGYSDMYSHVFSTFCICYFTVTMNRVADLLLTSWRLSFMYCS